MRAAQDQGVRVTVIGITPASQEHNQSRELLAEADEVIRLERSDLTPFFVRMTKLPAATAEAPAITEAASLGCWTAVRRELAVLHRRGH